MKENRSLRSAIVQPLRFGGRAPMLLRCVKFHIVFGTDTLSLTLFRCKVNVYLLTHVTQFGAAHSRVLVNL